MASTVNSNIRTDDLFLPPPAEKRRIYKGEKFKMPEKTIYQLYLLKLIKHAVYRNFRIRKIYDHLHFDLGYPCNTAINMLVEMDWTTNGEATWIPEGSMRRILFFEVRAQVKKLQHKKIVDEKLKIKTFSYKRGDDE